MLVSVFQSVTTPIGQVFEKSWPAVVEALSKHLEVPTKESVCLFNLVEFQGSRRANASATAVYGLVLDFDHLTHESAHTILQTLQASGLEVLVYSTFSSTHLDPNPEVKMRVIIPYDRPATPDEHDRVWRVFKHHFPQIDPKGRPVHLAYYVPSCPPGSRPFVLHFTGVPLPVATGLALPVAAPGEMQNKGPNLGLNPGVRTLTEPAHPVGDLQFRRVVMRLARSRLSTAYAFEMLSKGRPFADPGSRDTVLYQMLKDLARELPNAQADSIAAQFESSLSFMALEAGAPTLENVRYKWSRAVDEIAAEPQTLDLQRTQSGSPKKNAENVRRVLEGDPVLAGVFAFNAFTQEVEITATPPWQGSAAPRILEDADITGLSAYFSATHFLDVTDGMVQRGLDFEARRHAYHPVREYLDSLTWDGVSRLGTWLHDFASVSDSNYTRKVGAWFLIQAVRRIYEPGCQADHMLVLEGAQGIGKSQGLRALCGAPWFLDRLGDMHDKDTIQELQGKWLVEIAELEGFKRHEHVTIKAFMTRQTDKRRMPYARTPVTLSRQCVFAGTTNDHHWLGDPTGKRRFWPVRCGATVDVEGLRTMRDQLWAEARARMAEQCWPETAEREEFAREASKSDQVDAWAEDLEGWIARPVGWMGGTITTRMLLDRAFGCDHPTRADEARAGALLAKYGFTRDVGGWMPPDRVKPMASNVLQMRAV